MKPESKASGEVPESQPSGDLAARIAESVRNEIARYYRLVIVPEQITPVIRESLAPIREALELADESLCCIDYGIKDHVEDAEDVKKALRLLRGEELSGNRGVGGGE